jgi:hypothetical protein
MKMYPLQFSPAPALDASKPAVSERMRTPLAAAASTPASGQEELHGSGSGCQPSRHAKAKAERISLSPTKLEPVMAALNLEPAQSPHAALARVHAAVVSKKVQEARLQQRLAEAEARNALLAEQLQESYKAMSRLQEARAGRQCGAASGASDDDAAARASPMVVQPLLLETHTIRPSRIETPPVASQLRWLQRMEEEASCNSATRPSPAQPPSQQSRLQAPIRPQRSPHGLLLAMVRGMQTPARTQWRRLHARSEGALVADRVDDEPCYVASLV